VSLRAQTGPLGPVERRPFPSNPSTLRPLESQKAQTLQAHQPQPAPSAASPRLPLRRVGGASPASNLLKHAWELGLVSFTPALGPLKYT